MTEQQGSSVSAPPVTKPSAILRGSRLQIVFSFPVMCMFLLSAVILAFSIKGFAEPDIWWHLRDGAYVAQHHAFPGIDLYSSGAAGARWLDHEWLSEVLFYAAYKAMGLRGVLLLSFTAVVLIYAGVYYLSCIVGADCKDAALATLVAISLGVVSIGPRTLLFGWLCMAILLIVLERARQKSAIVWALPPLFALWINLHPSWVFGMVVFVLTIISGCIDGEWGAVIASRWSASELKRLLLCFVSCCVALLVTPFGYKLALYPFDFLFRQQANMQNIEEWQPVDFTTGGGKLAMAVILAFFLIVCFSNRRWRLDHLAIASFAIWAGFAHTRLLFFLGLVLIPLLAPSLALFPPYEAALDKKWLNAAIMIIVLAAAIHWLPSNSQLQDKVDAVFPHKAVEYLQSNGFNGKIFNQYVWGGYLEWNAPEIKPFIDGRADIFVYNGSFDDYFRGVLMKSPLEVLDKYSFDYVLLQPTARLSYLLKHSSGWCLVYSDNVALIFQRVPKST